jgi:threonine dehydrogenase-like Zn-dependent dehydrogenase
MANLHEVPANVPDDAAIFVEPLAAACRILEQVRVGPGDRVLVLGLGRLGQLCARVLATTGASVTGSSRQAWRRALLPEGIHAAEPDRLVRGYDIVVDTTGAPEGLGRATALVRPLGTVVLKTTTHDLPTAAPTAWVIDEITVIGSRCGPFSTALAMLADGRVDPRPLITARYALADAERALGAGGMKVVIEG